MHRLVLFSLLLLVCLSGWGQEDPGAFESFVGLANNTDSRDEKVKYLRRAIDERSGDQRNLFLEFEIATRLAQNENPARGEFTLPDEALIVYKSILENYDYEQYYESQDEMFYTGQNLMVQAAIQAGALSQFEKGNNETSREYQLLAMEFLEKTYTRRKADWLNEKEPAAYAPPDPTRVRTSFKEKDSPRAYQKRLDRWKERKRLAEAGDVFGDSEMNNVKIAVKYYGLSYGR